MGLQELRSRLRDDKAFATAFSDEYPFEFAADALLQLRADLDLTQRELADLAGTTQSVIARAESGRHAFSISLLARAAGAAGVEVRVSFDPAPPTASIDGLTSTVVPITRPYRVTPLSSAERAMPELRRLVNA